jgi:glucose-6-phosphate isomerase
MSPKNIPLATEVMVDLSSGALRGQPVSKQQRTIGDLKGIFADEEARAAMPQGMIAYEVEMFQPIAEGTVGGLFFGNTTIQPIRVGSEYMMTKGHFHALVDRNEFYLGVRGEGFLLYMDTERKYRIEKMCPGSLHHIGPALAHRVINTGTAPLTFLACWPADAGHDYESIRRDGFPVRVMEQEGITVIVNT